MCTKPTIEEFKNYFYRDFPFVADINNPNMDEEILDQDIQKSIDESICMFNDGLFNDEDCCRTAFLYLTAHNLVEDIRNSSSGISGSFDGLLSSKSVGSVSSSFQFPQSLLNEPTYMMLSKTTYGAKYLNMIYPRMRGAVFAISGGTQP